MPSKTLRCEFCPTDFRKTDLPCHIKAKHMVELAKHLVQDAKDSSVNVISSFLKGCSAKAMPIPSRLYEGADYWFGAKPIMIEEKDDATPYLAVKANMDCHMEFIRELMDYVTLNDYISIGREIQVRSTDMIALKEAVKQAQDHNLELSKQHAMEMSKLMRELEDCKETLADVNDGTTHKELRSQIHNLQREVAMKTSQIARLTDDKDILLWKQVELEKAYNERLESTPERAIAMIELEEGYLKKIEHLHKDLAKEREKTALAKKEAKSSDKKKEQKERMKAELKAAKAKAKALARQLDNSDSDSSDSD